MWNQGAMVFDQSFVLSGLGGSGNGNYMEKMPNYMMVAVKVEIKMEEIYWYNKKIFTRGKDG